MDALLIVLGLFGVIPILTMGAFYTALPLVLGGLFVLGLGASEDDLPGRSSRSVPAPPTSLDRAA